MFINIKYFKIINYFTSIHLPAHSVRFTDEKKKLACGFVCKRFQNENINW